LLERIERFRVEEAAVPSSIEALVQWDGLPVFEGEEFDGGWRLRGLPTGGYRLARSKRHWVNSYDLLVFAPSSIDVRDWERAGAECRAFGLWVYVEKADRVAIFAR
jgi:hypothetical protein